MANFDLHKLMEAKNPQAVMLEETRGLKSKWQETGLLEGLKEREQHSMSVLLENQAKQLLDEATQTGTAPASEEWSGVALPLVRRIFGEIASKEFVSVQPMNLPSGLIFYLDFKYSNDQKAKPGFEGSSVFGGTGKKLGSTDAAVSGAYGDGRWGYSVRQTTSTDVSGTAVDLEPNELYAYIGFNSELSASVADGELFVVEYDVETIEDNAPGDRMQKLLDREGARSFFLAGDGVDFHPQYTQAYKSDDPELTAADPADKIRFVVQAADELTATGSVDITYSIQPKDFDRGDFEDRDPIRGENDGEGYDAGSDLAIPEIDLELRSEPIVAKTRKLKAVWTPELAQDLNAYHSIDAEAELTSMLSEYISLEIDLEILDMLKSNALTVDYWSTNIGEEFNSVENTWFADPGQSAGRYQKNTWYQTLGIKLNKVSNKIHQLTLRGGANFVVASPDVCTILESIPGFHVNADKDAMEFAAGVTSVGAIANRYTVYKNPYMTSNEILMGYKGNNFLETGAVYSPYVPLIMTPLVYDPTNFTPRRGVMTRYAKKIVRPEFYGKIFVKDLQNV